jgi:hypothetical protein
LFSSSSLPKSSKTVYITTTNEQRIGPKVNGSSRKISQRQKNNVMQERWYPAMHGKCVNLFVVLFISIIISGCTHNIRPATRLYLGSDRVFDKNYELGQKLIAYVGQPIIKVKDYKVDRYRGIIHMRASDDFVIKGGIVTVKGNKNTDYPVRGEITIDGETLVVLSIPGSHLGASFGALIKADGSVYHKALNGTTILVYSFFIAPSNLKFISEKDEQINADAGFVNYELIYAGTDGKSIFITYREYTSNDLAKPAFYQNVIYEAGQSQIRFRDTVIRVHEATNERIMYTVTADGFPN